MPVFIMHIQDRYLLIVYAKGHTNRTCCIPVRWHKLIVPPHLTREMGHVLSAAASLLLAGVLRKTLCYLVLCRAGCLRHARPR